MWTVSANGRKIRQGQFDPVCLVLQPSPTACSDAIGQGCFDHITTGISLGLLEACRAIVGRIVFPIAAAEYCICREKATLFSGRVSLARQLVAPAGSNPSGGEGNEGAGGFDVKGIRPGEIWTEG